MALKGENIVLETNQDVIRRKKLRKEGQTIRAEKLGLLYRIIEKREISERLLMTLKLANH